MDIKLHANATTTPKVRAYIQASAASAADLAQELGGQRDNDPPLAGAVRHGGPVSHAAPSWAIDIPGGRGADLRLAQGCAAQP